MKVTIVKLGGSSITYKDKDQIINETVLQNNLGELARVNKPFILIHGAGSFGHPLAKKYKLKEGKNALAEEDPAYPISETRMAMHTLHQKVLELGRAAGIKFYSLPVSASVYECTQNKYEFFATNVILALQLNLVPVLYGDIILSKQRGYTILSGDKIIEMLIRKLLRENVQIEQVVFGSDVDGIYTADPKKDPNATLITEVKFTDIDKVIALTTGSTSQDVTGGMRGKILNIKNMAQNGITVKIINLLQKNRLYESITTTTKGTTFFPPKD